MAKPSLGEIDSGSWTPSALSPSLCLFGEAFRWMRQQRSQPCCSYFSLRTMVRLQRTEDGQGRGEANPTLDATGDHRLERSDRGGAGVGHDTGRGQEGEGQGGEDLAAFFNSRASAFISRSRAREEAVSPRTRWLGEVSRSTGAWESIGRVRGERRSLVPAAPASRTQSKRVQNEASPSSVTGEGCPCRHEDVRQRATE